MNYVGRVGGERLGERINILTDVHLGRGGTDTGSSVDESSEIVALVTREGDSSCGTCTVLASAACHKRGRFLTFFEQTAVGAGSHLTCEEDVARPSGKTPASLLLLH